jgi:hypothetical protein
MTDVIEKRVVAPWRAARIHLESLLPDVPPRLSHLFNLLDNYAKDREQSFAEDETIIAGSASPQFVQEHKDREQKVQSDLDELKGAKDP